MKQNNDFWKSDKSKFVILFTGVFLGTFLLLYFIGFVPDELSPDGGGVLNDLKLQTLEGSNTATPDNSTDNSNQAPADAPASNPTQEPVKKIVGEKPLHITAATVGIDIDVENPKSEDNAILNEYLTRGAVHYPGSADLGAGNTFIFGHSSNWAVVHNKAYKALNR
jgi:hypothetical protein